MSEREQAEHYERARVIDAMIDKASVTQVVEAFIETLHNRKEDALVKALRRAI